ncbi:hypothetical protein, partial [Streptomyces sp. NPDC049744]|uniref:hypothetical protein n=1 Tax=Streptomyces sp. NPDC049744 TaxID=3154359 RepID=UPI0034128D21
MAYTDSELAAAIKATVFDQHSDGRPILPPSNDSLGKRLNRSIVRDGLVQQKLEPLAQAALSQKGFILEADINGSKVGLHPSTRRNDQLKSNGRTAARDARRAGTGAGYHLADAIRASGLTAQPEELDRGPVWAGAGYSHPSGTGVGYGLA